MGLGLYVAARISAETKTSELFDDIERVASEYVDDALGDPFSLWFWASATDETLYVNLCPLDENVEFIREAERVICSAKTSGSGPGYHVLVALLLDRLESELGLVFHGDEGGDETGYLETRDGAALQAAMTAQLRALAKVLLEHVQEGAERICLGFPLGFVPRRDAFALTCLGERSAEWFERVSRAEGAELDAFARDHYVLWDVETSADNFRKLGIALCWMEVPWTAPQNEREQDLYDSVLECFERAKQLDPQVALPDLELAELRRLARSNDSSTPPRPQGIGYLRGTLTRSLTGGWTVDLPGWFREQAEDDGTTQLFYFGDRTLRASSFSFEGGERSAVEVLRSIDRARDAERLTAKAEHLAAVWATEWDAEEQHHLAHVYVAKPNGVCCLTFCYRDAGDREWVETVSASVFAPAE